MRAAEQFVAREGDDVRTCRQRLLRRRLGRQAVGCEVAQGAAAEVDDEGQIGGVGDFGNDFLVDRAVKPVTA